jgi:thiamine biosynthesis lipoprotein
MPAPELHVAHFAAMGTMCEIQLFAASQDQGRELAERAIADVQRLEARYSRYRDDSELSAINRVAAAGGSIEVDAETAALLDYADTCHRQSDGLFDISSGLLRQAWRFGSGQLPDAAQVEALRTRIGWQRVRWQSPRLAFTTPGMELDFGGIVKEYAVDRAAALLAQAGVRHGLINLGGDLRIVGPQPDGAAWRIGIRHPRDAEATLATLELQGGALASSGDYERCIVVDGVRYGHILNPHTGWPVRTLAAVSVLAPHCVVAGSAATIAMLKEADGPAWLQEMQLPCLWVTVDGEVGGSLASLAPGR